MERTLDMTYDEIVIGADLGALLYSYAKKIPIIFTRHLKPYQYGIQDDYKKSLDEWDHLMFIMSINGYCPFGNLVQSIRLEDNNTLKVTTNNNFCSNISFQKLVISDDYKVEGLPEPIGRTSNDNCVIDYMGIFEYIDIIPYRKIGERVPYAIEHKREYIYNGNHHRQLYVTSIMSDEEIKQIEFSESYMRFRLKKWFEEPEKIRLRHLQRTSHSLGKNIYEISDNIRTLSETIEDLRRLEVKEDKYLSLIESKIKCYLQKNLHRKALGRSGQGNHLISTLQE